MATPARTLTPHTTPPPTPSLLTSITTILQSLFHQTPNPNPNFTPLAQFSPYLTPTLVTQVIKSQTNPHSALFFFRWASNPTPNPTNYSHTPPCYTAITDLLLSHCLFTTAATLLERSNHLSDFLISKFIKAHGDRGDIRGAIHWLDRAKSIDNNNCLHSYNAALGVLVRANRIELARGLFDQIFKEGVVKPDVSTYTVLIRGYCKLGRVDDAKKVFRGMMEMNCKPNLITYNTFLAGLCRKGDMGSAKAIFDEMMKKKECLPDTVTFTTMIDGYCKRNELEEAEKCLEEMRRWNCEPNVVTYNSLIYGLCMNGKIDEAEMMVTKMRSDGLKDNLATHTSLLKGFCIVGRSEDAAKHLREMVGLGLKPDAKAYGVVVNEYCKLRRPNEAIALLDEMKSEGLSPSISSFNALFRMLCDLGEHDRAILYLKRMAYRGCIPSFVSHSTVICSLCSVRGRMRDVEELVVDMLRQGHHPDIGMYNTMVRGYCEDGDVQMAMGVFYEMVEKGFTMNMQTFSVFVTELCLKGKASEVKKGFQEMCKRCPVPDVDNYKKILDENLCKLRDDCPDYCNSSMEIVESKIQSMNPSEHTPVVSNIS